MVAFAQRQIGSAWLQHGSVKLAGLAAHPALNLSPDECQSSLQPLDGGEFNRLSGLLQMTVEEQLGISFPVTGSSGGSQLTEKFFHEDVLENPTDRRNPLNILG